MRLGYEQYQRPANKHGLVGIYNERYCSRINCRGIVMKTYEVDIYFYAKERLPVFSWKGPAKSEGHAKSLAIEISKQFGYTTKAKKIEVTA
jgi:hypothetical protein